MDPKTQATPVLRPLAAAEFAAWLEIAVRNYAAEQVASGAWAADTALARVRADTDKLLPQGMHTPGNHFHAIVDAAGAQVGTLWIAEQERGGQRIAYVYDIAVQPEYQRQGHAMRALHALEDEARRLGLAGVALHVFGHNTGAQALYARMGYATTDISMFKALGA